MNCKNEKSGKIFWLNENKAVPLRCFQHLLTILIN